MTQSIKVDVFSDVACPWCYVGKRKLEQGITEFEAANPGSKVEVEYHSYQLNPDMPVDYEGGQADYLAQIKGFPLEQVALMNQRLGGFAKDVGLNYDFDAMQMTNTHLAHQLLQFAKTKGKQQQMKERIMSAHFVEGLHVGKVDQLVKLATDVGLDPDEVKTVLENGSFKDAVEIDIAQAREFGIQGVPFFVIQNKYGMEGAQNPDRFVYAFNTVLAEQAPNLEA